MTLMRLAPVWVAALLVALTPLPGETAPGGTGHRRRLLPQPGSGTRRTSNRSSPPARSLKMEAVPIGVTKPQRGYLEPGPVARFAWKALPPRPSRPASPKATRPRSPPISSIACSTCTWCRRSSSARSTARSAPRSVDREHQGLGHEEAGAGARAALVEADQPDEALRPAHRQHRPQPGQPHLRLRLAPLPDRSLARLHRRKSLDGIAAARHRRPRSCGPASRRSRRADVETALGAWLSKDEQEAIFDAARPRCSRRWPSWSRTRAPRSVFLE